MYFCWSCPQNECCQIVNNWPHSFWFLCLKGAKFAEFLSSVLSMTSTGYIKSHVPSFSQAFAIPVTMAYRVYWVDHTIFSGEVLGFENLVFSIFEFVNALVDGHKLSMRVESVLTDLLYYLILFMQITEEQVSNYSIMNFILWYVHDEIWILHVPGFYFPLIFSPVLFISVCLELY
jgi:hypothetical protein